MSWTKLPFGKHKGSTLPQVLLTDPDWFFWAVAENVFYYGPLAREIADLNSKARRLKICKPDPENWQVEYWSDENRRFLEFRLVLAESPYIGKRCLRLHWLDLSYIRRSQRYDKAGSRNLMRDVKKYYFGGRSLTKRRCEQFFEDEGNFVEL